MHTKYFKLIESISKLSLNEDSEGNQEIQISGTEEKKLFLEYLNDDEESFIRFMYEEGYEILDDESVVVILSPENTYIRVPRK